MYICVCVHPVCMYVCRRVCTRAYSIWYEITTLIWSSPHPSGSFYWVFFIQSISGEIVVKKSYISQVPLKYVCQCPRPLLSILFAPIYANDIYHINTSNRRLRTKSISPLPRIQISLRVLRVCFCGGKILGHVFLINTNVSKETDYSYTVNMIHEIMH